MNRIINIYIFSVVLFSVQACTERKNETRKYTEFHMNTYVNITVSGKTDRQIIKGCYKTMAILSDKIELEHGSNKIDDSLRNLVSVAKEISELTDGSYDPTIFPVTDLWGIRDNNWRIPDKKDLEEALQMVNWKQIDLTTETIELPENMGFDFGGVGKGWTVDRAVEYLLLNNVEAGIIDAGGDIKVFGKRIWKIGIRNPYREGIIAILKIKDSAIATSGDYENYYEYNSKKLHHIINPENGWPIYNEYDSITVITKDCAMADGIATGMFVMGRSGLERLEKLGYKFVLISENEKYSSPGINIEWL